MDTHTATVAKQRAADYVRYWREIAGMTPVQVAEASGVSRSKLYDIEEGRGGLAKPETLSSVARAIGRDPAELLSLVGIDPPGPVAAVRVEGSEAILDAIAADVRRVLENQERLGSLVLGVAEKVERIEHEVAPPSPPPAPSPRVPRKRSTAR